MTCHLTFSGANDDVERLSSALPFLLTAFPFPLSNWTFKTHLKICHNWPFHCLKPFLLFYFFLFDCLSLALDIPNGNIFQRIKCCSQMLLTYHNLYQRPFPYHAHSQTQISVSVTILLVLFFLTFWLVINGGAFHFVDFPQFLWCCCADFTSSCSALFSFQFHGIPLRGINKKMICYF